VYDTDAKTTQTASLTEKEAASEFRLSPAWFQRKRWDGTGPKFYKIGRAVRYPRAELEQYFNARLRTSTSDTGGGK
jgi:predicted DNA-binding transcriptional regulator AlpA